MDQIARQKKIDLVDQVFSEVGRYFVSQWLACEMEEINTKQFILLRALYRCQRSTVTDLASKLRLSTSATTIALNRLVKNGYVNRVRDEQDRRVVWVELTEKSMPLIQRLMEKRREFFTELLLVLSDDELEKLVQHLEKIRQGLP